MTESYPTPDKKQRSRRDFFKLGGGLAAGAAILDFTAGCSTADAKASVNTEPSTSPTPEATKTPAAAETASDGVIESGSRAFDIMPLDQKLALLRTPKEALESSGEYTASITHALEMVYNNGTCFETYQEIMAELKKTIKTVTYRDYAAELVRRNFELLQAVLPKASKEAFASFINRTATGAAAVNYHLSLIGKETDPGTVRLLEQIRPYHFSYKGTVENPDMPVGDGPLKVKIVGGDNLPEEIFKQLDGRSIERMSNTPEYSLWTSNAYDADHQTAYPSKVTLLS